MDTNRIDREVTSIQNVRQPDPKLIRAGTVSVEVIGNIRRLLRLMYLIYYCKENAY